MQGHTLSPFSTLTVAAAVAVAMEMTTAMPAGSFLAREKSFADDDGHDVCFLYGKALDLL